MNKIQVIWSMVAGTGLGLLLLLGCYVIVESYKAWVLSGIT